MKTIRILFEEPDGSIVDGQLDFDPDDFASQIPMVGDVILDPGVVGGLSRTEPKNRKIWTVGGRVFNGRDNADYVALIVRERDGTNADQAFL